MKEPNERKTPSKEVETRISWNYADKEVHLWSNHPRVIDGILKLKKQFPQKIQILRYNSSSFATHRVLSVVIHGDLCRPAMWVIRRKYREASQGTVGTLESIT